MTREEVVTHIRNARKSHVAWVQKIKALVMGIGMGDAEIEVDPTLAPFGVWFYDEGERLKNLTGMDILDEIERKHVDIHDEYLKIYNIYFETRTKARWILKSKPPKVKTKPRKVTDEDKKQAEIYLAEVEVLSGRLLNDLDLLMKRVNAMGDEMFKDI